MTTEQYAWLSFILLLWQEKSSHHQTLILPTRHHQKKMSLLDSSSNNNRKNDDLKTSLAHVLKPLDGNHESFLSKINPKFRYCEYLHREPDATVLGIYRNFGFLFECSEFDCECRHWVVCFLCAPGKQRARWTKKKTITKHARLHVHKTDSSVSPLKRPCDESSDSTSNNTKRSLIVTVDDCFDASHLATCDDYDDNDCVFADGTSDELDLVANNAFSARTVVAASEVPPTPPALSSVQNGVFSSERQLSFKECKQYGTLGFSSPKNERFFQYCKARDNDMSLADAGIEYLTKSCSFARSHNLNLSDLRSSVRMPKQYQYLLMDSAEMSFRSGNKHRQLLCSILKRQYENGLADGWTSCIDDINSKFNDLHLGPTMCHDFIKCKIAGSFIADDHHHGPHRGSHRYSNTFPKTPEEIRSKFLEGKNSILQNLPHPNVKDDIQDHAYVSMEDCIRDALALSRCRVQPIEEFSPSECFAMRWMFTEDDLKGNENHAELASLMLSLTGRLGDAGGFVSSDAHNLDNNVDLQMEAEHIIGDDQGSDGGYSADFIQLGDDSEGSEDSDDDDDYSIITENSSTPAQMWSIKDNNDSDDCASETDIDDLNNEISVSQKGSDDGSITGGKSAGAKVDDEEHPTQDKIKALLEAIKSEQSNQRYSENGHQAGYTFQHPSRSKRALEIWLNALNNHPHGAGLEVVVCYIKVWSDDCDTNSQSMAGRAQVWVKTMTLGFPSSDSNLVYNTYVLAIGRKGVSHDEVERVHADELKKLQCPELPPFYLGEQNKMVRCHIELMVSLGDQPEKREINGVARGNATWAARSFVSANHKALYPKLKACSMCIRIMSECLASDSQGLPDLPACDHCLNWDVLKQAGGILSLVKLPAQYPYEGKARNKRGDVLRVPGNVNRIVFVDGTPHLRPFRVTYESVHAAIHEAHYGYSRFGWTEANCKAFLDVECLDGKVFLRFLEYAKRGRAYEQAVASADSYDSNVQNVLEHQQAQPDLFGPMPLPAIHLRPGVKITSHVEGLMHLVLLGVVKRSVLLIRQVQALEEREKHFRTAFGKYLQHVIDLKLGWLELLEYKTKKLHGWNAVNYLGFLRIMPWFYQTYSESQRQSEQVHLPPDNTQPKWTMKQNRYWLKLRRLKIGGKATEISARVAKLMKLTPPPPILDSPNVDVDEIEMLMLSLLRMVECIFQNIVSDAGIRTMHYSIRLFLSCFDALDSKVRKPQSEPTVISSYNFQCLLNVPEQMRDYGPLRDHWEGKKQGESFLSEIKPLHKQGIRTNWESSLLKNVMRDRAFRCLRERTISRNKELVGITAADYLRIISSETKDFRKYSSIYEVRTILGTKQRERKKPLSTILVRDRHPNPVGARMFVVVGRDCGVVELTSGLENECSENRRQTKMGLHYYHFQLGPIQNRTMPWTEVISKMGGNAELGYAVLLPLLDREATASNCVFTVIGSNWKRLGPKCYLGDLVAD